MRGILMSSLVLGVENFVFFGKRLFRSVARCIAQSPSSGYWLILFKGLDAFGLLLLVVVGCVVSTAKI